MAVLAGLQSVMFDKIRQMLPSGRKDKSNPVLLLLAEGVKRWVVQRLSIHRFANLAMDDQNKLASDVLTQ